jgi:hypothetical protein
MTEQLEFRAVTGFRGRFSPTSMMAGLVNKTLRDCRKTSFSEAQLVKKFPAMYKTRVPNSSPLVPVLS